jgi:hypothetical protein
LIRYGTPIYHLRISRDETQCQNLNKMRISHDESSNSSIKNMV